jgi:hypothetical protein
MVSSLPFRRTASVAFAGTALALISAVVAGCGSDKTVPQQVFVNATISPTDVSVADPTLCMHSDGTEILQIGSISSSGNYSLVENESTYEGATVQVQCSVVPSGANFAVQATAVRSGNPTGGTVTISGTFTPSGTQTGLSVILNSAANGLYEDANCTAVYSNDNMGVAAGRVWATFSCPDLQLQGQANQCSSTTELRFENCTQ